MRRPWRTTAGGRHTETHDPHAHHHHEGSDRLFFHFLLTREQYNKLLTSMIFVELVEGLYRLPFTGNDPPQFSIFRNGRRSCAATCQITREDGVIIDIFMVWYLVRSLLFLCMPAGRHSDSTLDSRRVRLCSRLPGGSYGGAGSPTALVCSRQLVSCGNGGTLCCS